MVHVTQNLTEGKLARQIFLFSVPLMISNLLQALFNMADIMVVGQFVGPEALGSVGSTTILVTLFTGFLIGMGNGVNVMVARYFGARSDRDVSETVHTSLILCLLEGVVILVLGQLFSRAMLELLNTKEVLIDDAALYLRIYFLGMPFLMIYNFAICHSFHELLPNMNQKYFVRFSQALSDNRTQPIQFQYCALFPEALP